MKEAIRNQIVIYTCSEKMAPDNQNGPCLPPTVSLLIPRPFPIPLPPVGAGQLRAKRFPYLYASTQILGITSTHYGYEDGTNRKFRNVGTKSSDAGRSPKKHNTAFNTWRKFEINKNQSVYVVWGKSRHLFSDKYKTHKYIAGRTYSC